MIESILSDFRLPGKDCLITTFGSGLINNTWKIDHKQEAFLLQKVNQNVFKNPQDISDNIKALAEYLHRHSSEYMFVVPVSSINKKELIYLPGQGYFRLFPFVKNSFTYDTVPQPSIAYEAAKQFGKFTRLLSGFDATQLHITLPGFHNLSLRYVQFEKALINGSKDRIDEATQSIKFLKKHQDIVLKYEEIKQDPAFKIRVTHHDTKISNVLFNKDGKGLCVIDLDTVMPGHFISDVGDMIRTYVSAVSEEEKDFSKIEIRKEYLDAVIEGYLSEMENELTEIEKSNFIYSGKFMIYMQALRFLTDYINNDIYYGCTYPKHNLVRADNQIVLLKQLFEL